MNQYRRAFLVFSIVTLIARTTHAQVEPEWSGTGRIRLVVQVPPIDLGQRTGDQGVASCAIDFERVLRDQGVSGSGDLSSLQVHRIDDATGKPVEYPTYDGSRSAYDLPCRFDDDVMPEQWPGRTAYSSLTKEGRGPVVIQPRKARLFNRELLPKKGKIIWVHTQTGNKPTQYAIYFDALAVEPSKAWQVSPAAWIGDADVLRRAKGESLAGWGHFIGTAGDFDGDGLFDIIAGTEEGDLIWFPNHGKPGEPKFVGCRNLTDEQGPIDTGWFGVPFLFDWDNDGLNDVIVGTSGGVILWWKNVGTKEGPKLSYRSFVRAGDKPLQVPKEPVPEDHANIFKRDYYTQPWVGDWDGDGLPDIVTGGYTTGMIWLYKSIGRDENGVPKLEYVGPLEADGKPIDTTWAAAPSVADFDGDGDLDLLTGSWWWSGIPREPAPGEIEYLMYYRNDGTRTAPRLTRVPFPRDGECPAGGIARPSLVDWNADGLTDLLVTQYPNAYVFLNVGSGKEPKWKTSDETLTVPWGFASRVDLTAESANVVGDERPEFLAGSTFKSVRGSLHSPQLVPLGTATVNGKPISHPGPGYGDNYHATAMTDWDDDGKVDLLWGTHQGNIYLHRRVGSGEAFEFGEGELFKLKTGEPLKVGPPVVDSPEKAKDFTILQGSRIRMFAEDFDRDGIRDLVVTETFGNFWLFRNTKAGGVDTLEEPVHLAKRPHRTYSFVPIDWNEDGLPDVMTDGTSTRPGEIFFNETAKNGKPSLSAKSSRPFELPYMFWNTHYRATDYNGDGDRDMMVFCYTFSFYVEGSFLKHGYRPASIIAASRQK